MNWRAGVALSILAFVGGGLAVSWLASSELVSWGENAPQVPTPEAPPVPDTVPPVANPLIPATATPQILQPIADSTRTEAMLVAMAARRAIAAGVPLGELAPRLNSAFGTAQPQAVARVLAADREKLTPQKLLSEFDALAPSLHVDPGMSVARIRRELATLFVLRSSDSPPPTADAQLQQVRDYLLGGNVEAAIRLVATMQGAAQAKAWMAKAQRYSDSQKALDALEKAALAMPVVAQPPLQAPVAPDTAAPATEPATADTTG